MLVTYSLFMYLYHKLLYKREEREIERKKERAREEKVLKLITHSVIIITYIINSFVLIDIK